MCFCSQERYLNKFGYPCENGKWSEQPQLVKYFLKSVFSPEISAHVNMTGGHGKISLPSTEVFRIISGKLRYPFCLFTG